jgi:shikimate dehydrogenase
MQVRPKQPIRVGLIGSGIQESGSPAMHMQEAQNHNLQLSYELLDLDRLGDAEALEPVLLDAQKSGFAGVNITHPCKQSVIQYVHEVSEHAQALGAVNTVVFTEGRRIGHNTDWLGFAEGFRLGLPDAPLGIITQLGAGGAGSAVAYALLGMGARLVNILDKDVNKAIQLASILATKFGPDRIKVITSMGDALNRSDGLVNTTPVGMHKYPGLPLAAVLLRPSLWVAEVIYFPLETELLKLARTLGCRTVDGGGMAVFQAAESFRLFTGIQPDANRMLRWFRSTIQA